LRIDIVNARATQVDTVARQVVLDNGQSLAFDKLLIATGSQPVRPPIAGMDLPGVHPCWTLADARAIAALAKPGAKVLQMGAGFIGCIIMEALKQRGVEVAEDVGTVWSNLDVADASIDATEQQIAAAQIAFDGVREEASLGARTTLDVLDAEQDLLDARASRLSAEAQRYVGIYQLLASMGLLTVDHLGLGIPTYDPAAYYNAVRRAPTSIQGKKLERILKSAGGN
jgi:hypothetical protein